MTPLPVLDALSGWRLAPDTPRPVAARPQAVLRLVMRDEITALPPLPPPAASTSTVGFTARATRGGLAGLVGAPLSRFRPGFISGATLQLGLAGPGFLPLSLSATIGAEPGYPAAFAPADLGIVALHRSPVVLAARTVSRTRIVRAGASVTLAGVWWTLADLVNPPGAPDLVTLASPLYADRAATATIARQNLTAAPPAEAKLLLRPGNVGDPAVRLSDQVALAPGTVLALDPGDPERAEYLAVTAITEAGIGPGFPATAVLAFPLARAHSAGAVAIRMIPAAPGAANTLARPASVGDVTLFPVAMAGLDATMDAVVIAGGGADEYHAAGLFATTSDAAGYARLPPIHRVAQLRLRVHHPAEPVDLLRDVMPPFGADALFLDLVFP